MSSAEDSAPAKDNRGKQPGVPFGYESLITDEQQARIESCQNYGWELKFIRRPLFLKPTVVMVDADNNKSWEVTETGELEPFLDMRD